MEDQEHIGRSHAIISAVPGTGSLVQGKEGQRRSGKMSHSYEAVHGHSISNCETEFGGRIEDSRRRRGGKCFGAN